MLGAGFSVLAAGCICAFHGAEFEGLAQPKVQHNEARASIYKTRALYKR